MRIRMSQYVNWEVCNLSPQYVSTVHMSATWPCMIQYRTPAPTRRVHVFMSCSPLIYYLVFFRFAEPDNLQG